MRDLYFKHLGAPGELGERLRGTGMQAMLSSPSPGERGAEGKTNGQDSGKSPDGHVTTRSRGQTAPG